MSYAFRSVGAVAVGNGSLNPGAPAGAAVGDLLLLSLVGRDNGQTAPAPTGWTLISPASPVGWNYLYARIADGTGLDTPSGLLYTGTTRSQAQISAFSGGGFPLGSIVTNSVSQYLPGTQTTIRYDAGLTITPANCLVIAVGTKNKTVTSNGTTINSLAGFTQIDSNVETGTDISQWWGYQIQTTPTNIAASLSQTLTGTTETLQYTSLLVALQSASSVFATSLTYAYSLGSVTFSTTNPNNPYLLAAGLNYNYSLASASSDFEVGADPLVYATTLRAVTLAASAVSQQNNFLTAATITYSFALKPLTTTVFTPIPGTFPNVVGMILQEAEQVLQAAGALVPAALGYFGSWPIQVIWAQSGASTGTIMNPGIVIAQSPAAGTQVIANSPIVLTVNELPFNTSYPSTPTPNVTNA